jgi:hypothetical protein
LQPGRTKTSPLDVPVLGLKLTRKEIVEFVHAGRMPTGRASKAKPRRVPSARKKRSPRRG